ncbi:MAG TPA: hypothetical protein VGR02_18660 [Thermoanaerobaculia bacterium]|jgi:hypothetical protein|nr:hypothetical protein [Thermoanaerobaculia bacterium]
MRIVALLRCALAVLVAIPLYAAQTAPPPAITFEAKGVTVTGLTPGGAAAMFMMSRQPDVYITRLKQDSAMLTGGKDGTARYEANYEVVQRSVWAVIDIESGQYAVACPSGDCAPLRRTLNTGTFFKNNAAGEPEGLDIPMEMADVFLVSPKSGVWHVMLGDGGEKDEDGLLDGKSRLSVEKFTGFHTDAAPPKKLKKGDLLLCFQPMNLHFAVIEVTK